MCVLQIKCLHFFVLYKRLNMDMNRLLFYIRMLFVTRLFVCFVLFCFYCLSRLVREGHILAMGNLWSFQVHFLCKLWSFIKYISQPTLTNVLKSLFFVQVIKLYQIHFSNKVTCTNIISNTNLVTGKKVTRKRFKAL